MTLTAQALECMAKTMKELVPEDRNMSGEEALKFMWGLQLIMLHVVQHHCKGCLEIVNAYTDEVTTSCDE